MAVLVIITVAQGSAEGGVTAVLAGALLLLSVGAVLLVMLSRSIRRIQAAAERFSRGELREKVAVTGLLPLAELADSLNDMARQLEERIATVELQRNQLESVLFSMAEGVITFDRDERVTNVNRAASQMLQLGAADMLGRSIYEVVRNTTLPQFVGAAIESTRPIEGEIEMHVPARIGQPRRMQQDRVCQVQGTPLRSPQGQRIGAMVVLHDVTRVRQLEQVRRDFVANVSHEIKTPVTAIKAAIETLLEGIEDGQDPADTLNFLHMAARQADRLHAIIEDLLTLARLEQASDDHRLDLKPGPVIDVLRSAVETCRSGANAKSITIDLHCCDDLEAGLHSPMLEQAVVNLLDNAIKYSPDGTTAHLTAEQIDHEIVIAVRDEGPGIAPAHLDRIFERFYRIDKARSREMGGTGLGLAIVKHVTQAHGGRVTVESAPGRGSTFRIHLPAP